VPAAGASGFSGSRELPVGLLVVGLLSLLFSRCCMR
jgi:hypothetical protein